MNKVVEIIETTKRFGGHVAVSRLSACIEPTSIFGFIGPNGAGKTTIMRMLLGIIGPDEGRVEVFGRRPVESRDRIGYMPEERGLYPRMIVAHALHYIASLRGLCPSTATATIEHWLARTDLTSARHKRIVELSRGMQQKLQFVATVIHDPSLLVLDEPFANLDPVGQNVLETILRDLQHAGKTIVLSTHNLAQAERMCDSLLLIDRGCKRYAGPLRDLHGEDSCRRVVARVVGRLDVVSLPGVESFVQKGDTFEFRLKDGVDLHGFLEHLIRVVTVKRFEAGPLPLEDLYHDVVRNGHA